MANLGTAAYCQTQTIRPVPGTMPGVKLRGAVMVGPPKSMAGHGLSEDSWDMLAYRKWNIIKMEYMESLKLGSMPFHERHI